MSDHDSKKNHSDAAGNGNSAPTTDQVLDLLERNHARAETTRPDTLHHFDICFLA